VETIKSPKKNPQEAKLQWGHRFTSVETNYVICFQKSPILASMGPPIYIGGNVMVTDNNQSGPVASMGPPIYIGGNFGVEVEMECDNDASMGPPIYIGGN